MLYRAPRPAKVLYLDGELPGAVLQKRRAMHLPDREPAPGFLKIFTPDLLPDGAALPDLSTIEGQAVADGMMDSDTALVVIDNLSVHKTKAVRELFNGSFRQMFLPTHSC